MIFFFIFTILVLSVIVLISLFSPQTLPWYRPHLLLNASEIEPIQASVRNRVPMIMEGLAEPESEKIPDMSSLEKAERLENILNEKNSVIEKLQKQLAAERAHRIEFEKVQTLLNQEIQNLRTQNKELKQGEVNA